MSEPQARKYVGAQWAGADLSGRDLREWLFAKCELRAADLRGADLRGAKFAACDLTGVRLDGAKLDGCAMVMCDLANAVFDEARVGGLSVASSKLSGVSFAGVASSEEHSDDPDQPPRGMRLVKCELSALAGLPAELSHSVFVHSDLAGVSLGSLGVRIARDSLFVEASLVSASLAGVSFERCQFARADLTGADLSSASFDGCGF